MAAAVAVNLHERVKSRGEVIQQQFAILEGKPLLVAGEYLGYQDWSMSWRNRVIFPLTLKAAASLGGLKVEFWYLLLRYAWAVSALWIAGLVLLRETGRRDVMALGLGILGYLLLPTFLTNWMECPSDFPDLAFSALFCWAVAEGRRWSLLALAVGASFNRESAVFAGVLWFFVHGWKGGLKLDWKESIFSGAICMASIASVVLMRSWTTGLPPSLYQARADDMAKVLEFVLESLKKPSPHSFIPLAALNVALLCAVLWPRRKHFQDLDRRFLLAGLAIFVISLRFGALNELRVFIPVWTLFAFIAARVVAAASGKTSGEPAEEHH